MKFMAHASSSMGNFYEVVASNGTRLLIDPGLRWSKIIKKLGHNLENICSCLVTHEHQDHAKSVEAVMENGIDVYASAGTLEALGVVHRRAKVIRALEWYVCKPFGFFAFDVKHDAAEPLGFIVHDRSAREYLLFATDTSHITHRFALEFSTIALSCSYDADVLAKREETGDINSELAKRLLTSHMERRETARYIREFCCLDKCTEIQLLHTSAGNLNKEAVRAEFEREFMITTHIAGQAARRKPSSRSGPPASFGE